MGSSISPVKAELVTSEAERRAWSSPAVAKAWRFLEGEESLCEIINGKRIADDACLASRVLCSKCMWVFAKRLLYRRPLLPEQEESGREVQLADRRLRVVGENHDCEDLVAERVDKNSDFIIGASPEAVRVRYCPNLGYTSCREMGGWIIARLADEVNKVHTGNHQAARLQVRTVDCAAELLLLGYSTRQVGKAFRYVRQPRLELLREVGLVWLSQLHGSPAQREIQDAAWAFRKQKGILV